jgi:hypothetical protein
MCINANRLALVILLLGWIFLGEFAPGDSIDYAIVNGEEMPIWYDSTAKGVLFLSDNYTTHLIGKDEGYEKWMFWLYSKQHKIKYVGFQKIQVWKNSEQ